jgi:hypothetical protein
MSVEGRRRNFMVRERSGALAVRLIDFVNKSNARITQNAIKNHLRVKILLDLFE